MSEEGAGEGPARRAGTVALVGRPNAGKSTLLNRVLQEKVAIVSDKPQTTRHRLVGILTSDRGQIVFLDTPGIHRPLHRMNRDMVRTAVAALSEADVICLLVDASERFGRGDHHVLELLARVDCPRFLALNKIDRIAKPSLLPRIDIYRREGDFTGIVPVSALTGDGVDELLEEIWNALPEGKPLYEDELLTVHSERFLAAERIREKVLEATRDELPFSTAVIIEDWREDDDRRPLRIHASILVDRPGQKKILVGRGGQMIRDIGTAARQDLEDFLERKVFLDLHVRLERNWRERPRLLAELDRDLFGHER